MTRKKLLNMLDQYKWRRRQVNDFFLCKTRAQRKHLKQQFLSTYATLDTTAQAVNTGLKELKQQILETAAFDKNEINYYRIDSKRSESRPKHESLSSFVCFDKVIPVGRHATHNPADDSGANPRIVERKSKLRLKFANSH